MHASHSSMDRRPPTPSQLLDAARSPTPLQQQQQQGIPHKLALSMWLLSSRSAGDPMWGNLMYTLPMDCYVIIYSPLLQTKAVRLYTEPSLALPSGLSLVLHRPLSGQNGAGTAGHDEKDQYGMVPDMCDGSILSACYR